MKTLFQLFCASLILFALGCGPKETETTKNPRPVRYSMIQPGVERESRWVTASVGSWKTEEISFEIGGRIKRVVEPSQDVVGLIPPPDADEIRKMAAYSDEEGLQKISAYSEELATLIRQLLAGEPIETEKIDRFLFNDFLELEPTEIAVIDDQKFRFQLNAAKAQLEQAKLAVKATDSEVASIDAQIKAAKAEVKLANTELARAQRLEKERAGPQADVDRWSANVASGNANIEQLKASKAAKQAQLELRKSEVVSAEQALSDAERDLNDCTLFSSFPGQVAEIHVVPGSIVAAGNPVATVQMMNPIKVEFEVSAAESRILKKRQVLPVRLSDSVGQTAKDRKPLDGFLYLVDTFADPQTRTYTVTLLVINEKSSFNPPGFDPAKHATCNQMWQLNFKFIPGASDKRIFVSENAIHKDSEGFFIWKVNNVEQEQPIPADGRLEVEKVRVEVKPLRIPFLGNFNFQQVQLLDDRFDVSRNLVAGKLSVPGDGDPDEWTGNEIFLNPGQPWIMQPGDLVSVNLSQPRSSEDTGQSYFVPMDAISYQKDSTSIYIVVEEASASLAKKIPVRVIDQNEDEKASRLRKIVPVDSSFELNGKKLIVEGVHYLEDGEQVKPIESSEVK